MNNFRRNLLIGFNASLAILIISSVASYFSISNLLESAQWVNHTHEVIQTLESFRSSVTDAESMQRAYLLTGDQHMLSGYNEARTVAMQNFAKVRSLTTDNPDQQALIPAANDIVIERFNYLDKSARRRAANEAIVTEDLQTGYGVMQRLRAQVDQMEQNELALLRTRTADLNKFSSFTPTLIVIAAILALLITISFYLRIRKDFEERVRLQEELVEKDQEITNRIAIIKSIADKIAQGSYDIRVDDKQSDALGSVAGSLNRMAESLQYSFNVLSEKEWLQNGLARLSEVMLGEKDTETLCHDVIDMLAGYTNSQVGMVYLSQGNELQPVAGFACLPNRPSIKVGDGALGQAVASRKVVSLKDIPETNVTITFATGKALPVAVVAYPVTDGYAVAGAIELGSLANYSERELAFLEAGASMIGIAINISLNRRRLQHLLDETQAQTEELRVQHTEMENLNSELEVQSEKLQASEEELKVQQEELKQANQELEERSRLLEEKNLTITERNIDIQSQADELAQSTRYKSEFLANMSHELRTPLNSILLLSRLLTENLENNLSTDQIEYARVIQSSGNGLLSLIDEILDLSKIEAGKMQLEYQHVSLNEIVGDLEGLFGPLARDKHIEYESDVDAGLPASIETDKLRLEQILRNLLSNAIKFTARGSVKLNLRRGDTKEMIQFVITDTGIGIPADKQQLIFDAFQQADGSTRRKFGGTGLGLSISRELAKLLGGEITLQSNPGQGSEFTVSVPLRKAVHDTNTALLPVQQLVVSRTATLPSQGAIGVDKFISPTIPPNIPDDRNNIGPHDKTILIVEDDINFAKSLLAYTRNKGYKAVAAVRGDEGIELAAALLPVGILLDIQLPVKSGWEVMDELKRNPLTRHIPVHIMSSFEMKNEGRMLGAIDFINKPVTTEQMQEIFQRIEYVLTKHPKKVLIVEENAQHAKALAYYLESFAVNTEVTSQLDQTIQSFNERNADCVILDMGVPDQSSYDTLEAIKKTPGLEGLPIIIFTGRSMSHAEEMRIKQYADTIVIKTAHSYKRILDEVSLFLHLMEKDRKEPLAAPKYAKLGALNEVLKSKTVLVADDDMRNIFSLTKALEKYEMNVIAAVDGKDALQKLKSSPQVDIVLMDMMMPEMDGYESTRAIRNIPQFRRLPIIAVTAKAMMGDRAKCIDAGASDYITKPIDADQLFSLLRVWLYEGAQ
ncbi:MAG TPA: response regulator [Chryseolinea sp.]|nr:response regulator [Chryseolinea sp.]